MRHLHQPSSKEREQHTKQRHIVVTGNLYIENPISEFRIRCKKSNHRQHCQQAAPWRDIEHPVCKPIDNGQQCHIDRCAQQRDIEELYKPACHIIKNAGRHCHHLFKEKIVVQKDREFVNTEQKRLLTEREQSPHRHKKEHGKEIAMQQRRQAFEYSSHLACYCRTSGLPHLFIVCMHTFMHCFSHIDTSFSHTIN